MRGVGRGRRSVRAWNMSQPIERLFWLAEPAERPVVVGHAVVAVMAARHAGLPAMLFGQRQVHEPRRLLAQRRQLARQAPGFSTGPAFTSRARSTAATRSSASTARSSGAPRSSASSPTRRRSSLADAIPLEQIDDWAVQRAHDMTLDTIASSRDDPLVSLPAVAPDQPGARCRRTRRPGHDHQMCLWSRLNVPQIRR